MCPQLNKERYLVLYKHTAVIGLMYMFSSSTTWDRSTTHPKFDPTGSNSRPPDYHSALHVTETPSPTTRPSVTSHTNVIKTLVPQQCIYMSKSTALVHRFMCLYSKHNTGFECQAGYVCLWSKVVGSNRVCKPSVSIR